MSENRDGARKVTSGRRKRPSHHQKPRKAQQEKDERLFTRVDRRDRKIPKEDNVQDK